MRQLICRSDALVDGGDAWVFELTRAGACLPAFVQRWRGRLHAYVNRCAHVPVELDWNPGKLLDDSGQYLICAMHGALYAPDTGECVAGPCVGQRLQALQVCEDEGLVYLESDDE